jgi:hypothetical protein
MIDVVEVEYRVVKVKQQKYGCRCGSCDHIPLERQVRILERCSLTTTSQTLWDLA